MRFRSVQTAKLDRLDRQLEFAQAVTVALFREVMESAGERLSMLQRAGKTTHTSSDRWRQEPAPKPR